MHREAGRHNASYRPEWSAPQHGWQHGADEHKVAADGEDAGSIQRSGSEHQCAPAESSAKRGKAKPGILLPLAGDGQAAGHQRQISCEQRQIGIGAAGERRRGEPADQAENRARQAKAEGEDDRKRSHAGQPGKGERGVDQAVMGAGEIEACVKRRETRACQGLANTCVADAVLETEGEFGRSEQRRAEAKAHRHPNRLDQHALIDRPADKEEACDGKRDAATPDREQAAEDLLEIEAGTEAVASLEEGFLGLEDFLFGHNVCRDRWCNLWLLLLEFRLGLIPGGHEIGCVRQRLVQSGPSMGDVGRAFQLGHAPLDRFHPIPDPRQAASQREKQQDLHHHTPNSASLNRATVEMNVVQLKN